MHSKRNWLDRFDYMYAFLITYRGHFRCKSNGCSLFSDLLLLPITLPSPIPLIATPLLPGHITALSRCEPPLLIEQQPPRRQSGNFSPLPASLHTHSLSISHSLFWSWYRQAIAYSMFKPPSIEVTVYARPLILGTKFYLLILKIFMFVIPKWWNCDVQVYNVKWRE